MIVFACNSCGCRLRVADNQAGKKGKCPRCAAPFQVPATAVSRPTVPAAPSPPAPPSEAATLAPVPPVSSDAAATAAYVPSSETAAPPTNNPSLEQSARAAVEIPGYEVLGELGRGGMGVIYQARQLSPRRLVALKMILAGEYAGADALARFHNEAEAVARLSHPNIVPIHQVGEHNGRPYLTLEFVEGGNLAQKLRAGSLPFREAAELLQQLAQAVHFAHSRGIIHRDLKPANILLAPADADSASSLGVPKITDFGLAKQRDGMVSVAAGPRTQSGAILGTPSYMAPEQAGGKSKDIGPAADVYALGAILYECLTGSPPFQAESMIDTLLKVAAEEPTPPRKLRPDCPRDLQVLCLKCLEKDPKQRYASAGDLADDLRRWLDGKPISCRSPSKTERLVRSLKRRREFVYLAAGVFATVCASLLIVALWYPPWKATAPLGVPAPKSAESSLELPEDLRLIPADAVGFASVRVADLWGQQTIKDLGVTLTEQKAIPAAQMRSLAALERDSGIGLSDVERATLVLLNDRDPNSVVLVLALAKPCDPDRVRQALAKQWPLSEGARSRIGRSTAPLRREKERASAPSMSAFCFWERPRPSARYWNATGRGAIAIHCTTRGGRPLNPIRWSSVFTPRSRSTWSWQRFLHRRSLNRCADWRRQVWCSMCRPRRRPASRSPASVLIYR